MVAANLQEWQGMTTVALVFGAMLTGLRLIQYRFNPDPELIRKLMHLGMGVFTLGIPYLLSENWAAFLLCGAMLTILIAIRTIGLLRLGFGSVLGCVSRISYGEIYFAVAIMALFYLARNSILLYSIPILIMTFADAAAALLGQRLGKHRYQGLECEKSLEGSLAFFLTAIFLTFFPLILLAALPVTTALLIAATLASILTLIEALSWRGLDNLLVPVAGYALLNELLFESEDELSRLLIFVFLIGAGLFFNRSNFYESDRYRPGQNIA